jgi:uncharacterized protein YkwD
MNRVVESRRFGRIGWVSHAALAGVAGFAFLVAASVASSGQDLSSARPTHARKVTHSKTHLGVGAAAAMVSRFRRSHGLPAVKFDSHLMAMARRQAQAMATHDRMSHDVDADFGTRLHRAGYRAAAAAENIAAGQRTLSEVFAAWVSSPPHRANLLLHGATRMGIAVMTAPGSKYGIYWAMVIASPRMTEAHSQGPFLMMPVAPQKSAHRKRKRSHH